MPPSSRVPLTSRIGLLSVVAVASLLLGACSSSGSTAPGDGASASGDLAAEQTAFAALPPEEQEGRLRTLSADTERQLVALSGLEKELGGPERAATAYATMTSALVTLVRKKGAPPGFVGKFGGLARTADTPSLGGMIFAGWMVGMLGTGGLVEASNDFKPGAEPVHDVKKSGDGSSVTLDGTIGSASMDVDVVTTANGVTGKLKVKIQVSPCPDASGTFTGHVTITAAATSAAGRVGSTTSTDVTITGHVDDDARLSGHDTVTKTEAAEFGNGANKWAESTTTMSSTGDRVTDASRTNGRSAGAVTPKFQQEWAQMGTITGMMVTKSVLEAAQKGWESGRCVALEPTTSPAKRSGLEPSSTVTIAAAPRSKIDGAPAGGTVTANLSGDTSVDPSGSKVKADATFTYVAPSEKDKSASVALEARSKRGVAKASVEFDTRPGSYKVSGTIPSAPSGIRVSGTICKVDQPFTVQTTGDMVGTASFTPKSATAGKVTFKGRVGNAPFGMTGGGTYTLEPPTGSGTGTLSITWTLTIHIPVVGDQTRTVPASLILTPTTAC